MIQWNVNLFLADQDAFDNEDRKAREADRQTFRDIRLQDTFATEGYDVIPNFFISAFVYEDRRYHAEENIRKHVDGSGEHCTKMSYHFPDRLFDRDTLFLSQYDVNFLYVLYLYARNKVYEKAQWREEVRAIFRKEIREVIQSEFKIYAMRAKLGVDGALYLQQHFYELNGRVYQPYGENREMYFAYARPLNKMEETQAQFHELSKVFNIEECLMGEDPRKVLRPQLEMELQQPVVKPRWLTLHYLERDLNRSVLVGYYRDEKHLQWIMGHNDRGSLVYNVRLTSSDDPRHGAHTAGFYERQRVKFVILYTDEVEKTGEYRVFHVKDTARRVSGERMARTWYPSDVKGDYFFYRFDEEVTIGKIRIIELLNHLKEQQPNALKGEPLFTTAEVLLQFRAEM